LLWHEIQEIFDELFYILSLASNGFATKDTYISLLFLPPSSGLYGTIGIVLCLTVTLGLR
jgi:hypothetical protein